MRYPTLRVCCFALNLLPFAGIAFLWFVSVLRDPMGAPRRPLLRHGVPRQRAPFSRDDLGLVGGCRLGGLMMASEAIPGKLMDSVSTGLPALWPTSWSMSMR